MLFINQNVHISRVEPKLPNETCSELVATLWHISNTILKLSNDDNSCATFVLWVQFNLFVKLQTATKHEDKMQTDTTEMQHQINY